MRRARRERQDRAVRGANAAKKCRKISVKFKILDTSEKCFCLFLNFTFYILNFTFRQEILRRFAPQDDREGTPPKRQSARAPALLSQSARAHQNDARGRVRIIFNCGSETVSLPAL